MWQSATRAQAYQVGFGWIEPSRLEHIHDAMHSKQIHIRPADQQHRSEPLTHTFVGHNKCVHRGADWWWQPWPSRRWREKAPRRTPEARQMMWPVQVFEVTPLYHTNWLHPVKYDSLPPKTVFMFKLIKQMQWFTVSNTALTSSRVTEPASAASFDTTLIVAVSVD